MYSRQCQRSTRLVKEWAKDYTEKKKGMTLDDLIKHLVGEARARAWPRIMESSLQLQQGVTKTSMLTDFRFESQRSDMQSSSSSSHDPQTLHHVSEEDRDDEDDPRVPRNYYTANGERSADIELPDAADDEERGVCSEDSESDTVSLHSSNDGRPPLVIDEEGHSDAESEPSRKRSHLQRQMSSQALQESQEQSSEFIVREDQNEGVTDEEHEDSENQPPRRKRGRPKKSQQDELQRSGSQESGASTALYGRLNRNQFGAASANYEGQVRQHGVIPTALMAPKFGIKFCAGSAKRSSIDFSRGSRQREHSALLAPNDCALDTPTSSAVRSPKIA
ncbi:unnamed protein product [Sphagnum tenellum]